MGTRSTPNGASAKSTILIVGGYGVVGTLIAQEVAPQFPGRVVIAGRDARKAEIACRAIGQGTRPHALDIYDARAVEGALVDVDTVMVCVAQRVPHLLRAAARSGLGYVDLSPRLAFGTGVEELGEAAQQSGARVLLGTGLSPGISNVMARQLAQTLGHVDAIQTSIYLSLGDSYGPDSMRHVFESVERPFVVLDQGRKRQLCAFAEAHRVDFPPPIGRRMAYSFPWSDVVYYPQTLGARTAIGTLALEPRWLGTAAMSLARMRLLASVARLAQSAESSQVVGGLRRRYVGKDDFALVVQARSADRQRSMSLVGQKQAHVTAAAAAEMLRMLAAREIERAGVWFAEQVVDPTRFFAALTRVGWHVVMPD